MKYIHKYDENVYVISDDAGPRTLNISSNAWKGFATGALQNGLPPAKVIENLHKLDFKVEDEKKEEEVKKEVGKQARMRISNRIAIIRSLSERLDKIADDLQVEGSEEAAALIDQVTNVLEMKKSS